ncbi:uncharacterized protein G2W53_007145 [Senna tora]|uniref:Uncharacterized protein n=1 Tax=Senna tora TaxID=362788 RepID=A0A834X735_9FABA|nr:uncharacterized protein G2W53_007145 [Senna tora]
MELVDKDNFVLLLCTSETLLATANSSTVAIRGLAESDEQGDCAAERLGVEVGREIGVKSRAEGVEEGDAVVDHRIDVEDVSNETVGDAVALVVDGRW